MTSAGAHSSRQLPESERPQAAAVPEAQTQKPGSAPAATAAAPAQPVGKGVGVGAFLNIDNAIAVEAMAERIMPGAPGKLGARDLGVLNYIDLALAGPYARLQEFYRQGLARLDAYCKSEFKDGFADLTAEEQDKVLAALQDGKVSGFEWPTAKDFFDMVRVHTWKVCSRIRSMAGTRSMEAGVSSDSRALRRCSPRRIWRRPARSCGRRSWGLS